ncbi:hypothetical protein ABW19_dt0202338 [Dactylella cylindrospora]|nr:hypothetical protein ABW19_dt0202338 [Dactylella cylindrospora]
MRRVRKGEDDSEGTEKEAAIKSMQSGLSREEGPGGVVVVGRHTWKEYVRGLHEGWLGSAEVPDPDAQDQAPKTVPEDQPVVTSISDALPEESTQENLESTKPDANSKDKEKEKEKQRKPQFPVPTILQEEYSSSTLPGSIPSTFQPSLALPFPHLLGFLNTPFRIQRYLTQRRLMDHVSREVASIALGSYRPYNSREEITDAYKIEEADWPKKWVQRLKDGSVEDNKDEPLREKTVVEELQVDGRIVERMKKFVLPEDDSPDFPALD